MKDEGSLGSLQTAPEMVCQTVVPLKINKEPGGNASFIREKAMTSKTQRQGNQALQDPCTFSLGKKQKEEEEEKKQNDRAENRT